MNDWKKVGRTRCDGGQEGREGTSRRWVSGGGSSELGTWLTITGGGEMPRGGNWANIVRALWATRIII